MRFSVVLSFLFLSSLAYGQTHKDSVLTFQRELNEFYAHPDKSPLLAKDLKTFEGHPFFEPNETFRVKAKFERVENALPFFMKTTTDRLPKYQLYGVATFEINGETFQLSLYQSLSLRKMPEEANLLFLPFTDLTNGHGTYDGGRFIDIEIPMGDTIVIDFNRAYNPYCAYSPYYSCPIPPKENHLETEILAGVQYGGH
ncbi:MAG: DUF1684 domain-containing protein [Bacteroidota bacterium]